MTIPLNDNFLWIEPDFTSTGLWHYEDGAAVPVFPEDLPLRPETAARLQAWQDWFETEYDPNHLWATEARKQEFEREAWRIWRMLRDDLAPDFEVGHRLLYNRDFSPAQAEFEYERLFGHPAYPAEPPAEVVAIINEAIDVNREGFERSAALARQGDDLLHKPEWDFVDQVVSNIWYADGGRKIRDDISWERKARATMHLYDRCPTWWVGSTVQDFWDDIPEPVRDEFWSWTLVTLRRPAAFSRPLADDRRAVVGLGTADPGAGGRPARRNRSR